MTIEYSRYFINQRFDNKFANGLFALERNWVGPLKDNDGVFETLELFQEMEKQAMPCDKLNWRFQQALYRAYYDAYIKHRLAYETNLEAETLAILKKAKTLGSEAAMDKALAILAKADARDVASDLYIRVAVLAEALFQSIRMQHSVEKYHSQRYANLDDIHEPLNDREDIQEDIDDVRKLGSEQERLAKIAEIATKYSEKMAKAANKKGPENWPDWTVEFDNYQHKRSGLFKPLGNQ